LKGFKETRGLVLEDKLLIPMRNVSTNKLQGYQSIRWVPGEMKYEKKMLTGMRAKNAVLYLGDRSAPEAWLVEGFATGLSVRHALRSVGLPAAVVICFSASNMIQVADQIKGNRFVFADNDESKTGEKSAMATGLPWTMADEVGQDANDLHLRDSLFAVVGKIMECRTKAQVYC
jgi:putative DNA primase/helicase